MDPLTIMLDRTAGSASQSSVRPLPRGRIADFTNFPYDGPSGGELGGGRGDAKHTQ